MITDPDTITWRKSKACIEPAPDLYPCWYSIPPIHWNGWSVPEFELETAKQVAQDLNNAGCGTITWDESRRVFVYDNPDYTGQPGEEYTEQVITADGKQVSTWAIGFCSWCWCEPENMEAVA
jgi:hypothetical protein